jgi:hypothetical protein
LITSDSSPTVPLPETISNELSFKLGLNVAHEAAQKHR